MMDDLYDKIIGMESSVAFNLLGDIQEVLWKESGGEWNPEKEWNASTVVDIANLLIEAGIGPD